MRTMLVVVGWSLLWLPASEITVVPLHLPAPNVVTAERMTGTKTSLWVHFGDQGAIDFRAVAQAFHAQLERATAVPDAVFLIGHGGGVTIGGTQLDAHLRAQRAFYETLGGARPAQPLACLVVASCANGAADQLVQMRDGLGYYPTWRVATGDGDAANILTVLAALKDVVDRPAQPSYRARYRIREGGVEVTSFGEVGEGGARSEA
jgi:hypothetical protein